MVVIWFQWLSACTIMGWHDAQGRLSAQSSPTITDRKPERCPCASLCSSASGEGRDSAGPGSGILFVVQFVQIERIDEIGKGTQLAVID